MKHKILLPIFLFLTFSFFSLNAQDYNTSIGGKVGYGLVASYKKFLNESAAIDLFGGLRWGNGIALGAYYEKHTPIDALDRLQWYWGFGGSFTTWSYNFARSNYYEVGASGVLGLDYSFDDYPLNLSLDWAPTIVLLSNYDTSFGSLGIFRGGYGALSIRYILN